jgi:hypothetical protein
VRTTRPASSAACLRVTRALTKCQERLTFGTRFSEWKVRRRALVAFNAAGDSRVTHLQPVIRKKSISQPCKGRVPTIKHALKGRCGESSFGDSM